MRVSSSDCINTQGGNSARPNGAEPTLSLDQGLLLLLLLWLLLLRRVVEAVHATQAIQTRPEAKRPRPERRRTGRLRT